MYCLGLELGLSQRTQCEQQSDMPGNRAMASNLHIPTSNNYMYEGSRTVLLKMKHTNTYMFTSISVLYNM